MKVPLPCRGLAPGHSRGAEPSCLAAYATPSLRLRIDDDAAARGFGPAAAAAAAAATAAAFFPARLLPRSSPPRSWRCRAWLVPCSAVSAATRASALATMSSIVVCRYCRMPPVVEIRLSSPRHHTTCSRAFRILRRHVRGLGE